MESMILEFVNFSNNLVGHNFLWLTLTLLAVMGSLVALTAWQALTLVVYYATMPFAGKDIKVLLVDIDLCMHLDKGFKKYWLTRDRKVVNRYRRRADLDPLSEEEYMTLFNQGRDPDKLLADQLAEARGKPTSLRFLNARRRWRLPVGIQRNRELRRALKDVKRKLDVKLVAYTDNPIGRRMLLGLGVWSVFNGCIVVPAEFGRFKKDLNFRAVLRYLRVTQHQVAVFGDSESSDIAPARRAGVPEGRLFKVFGPDELTQAFRGLIEN